MKIIKNFQLKEITTFNLPSVCNYFCEYESEGELIELLNNKICQDNKVLHIGGGSNLLFTQDFNGIILHSRIKYIETVSENQSSIVLKVGSGVVWDDFVKYCVDNEYYGVENLSYIPGEVGASAVQNIGSYGAEVKDVIKAVHTLNIEHKTFCVFDAKGCKYDYRDSIFKNEYKDKYIVTAVEYELSKLPHFILEYGPLKKLSKDNLNLSGIRNEIINIRCSKLPDPKYIGSVGSFFKNPIIQKTHFDYLLGKYPNIPNYRISDNLIKVPAGWLIEQTGMKGHSIGDAQVYEKQCLVLVNNGKASANDVVELYKMIIKKVKEQFNIELHPEANIL